jgi:septal ring factor EnvC (AmiA/AmiB activator)
MNREAIERLGSAGETTEQTIAVQPVLVTATQHSEPLVTIVDPQPAPSHDSNLKQMLAGFMEIIQQSQASLQESVRAEMDKVRSDIGSVKADMGNVRSDIGSVKADISGVKTDLGNVSAELSSVKTDFTANNERLQNFQDKVGADLDSVVRHYQC